MKYKFRIKYTSWIESGKCHDEILKMQNASILLFIYWTATFRTFDVKFAMSKRMIWLYDVFVGAENWVGKISVTQVDHRLLCNGREKLQWQLYYSEPLDLILHCRIIFVLEMWQPMLSASQIHIQNSFPDRMQQPFTAGDTIWLFVFIPKWTIQLTSSRCFQTTVMTSFFVWENLTICKENMYKSWLKSLLS